MMDSVGQLSDRERKWFAASWLIVLSLVAAMWYWRYGWTSAAFGLEAVALLVPLVGWFVPRVLEIAHRSLSLVTQPLGWCLSWLVLALIFFFVVTPIGCVMRLRGHDALRLKPSEPTRSYWMPRSQRRDVSNYFRQF